MTQAKHIAVYGATSGIGRALVETFQSCNKISAFGRRGSLLEEISAASDNIRGYQCDVSDKSNVQMETQKAVHDNGKIDVLIYTAGLQILKPHRLMSQQEFHDSYGANLGGALNVSSVFCSKKISNSDAVFCAITSVAATLAESGMLAYSAEKSAMQTLIKGLAKEVAPKRFVGIAPGFLDTPMTQSQNFYSDAVREQINSQSPLGLISMTDVLEAVKFITSKAAKSITGQILVVDGGFSV